MSLAVVKKSPVGAGKAALAETAELCEAVDR